MLLGLPASALSLSPLCAYPPRFGLSRCALGPWPGCFHSVSGKNQSRTAGLGFSPSLRSKLPYGPKLRASRCHAAAAAPRAASLRLGLKTGPLRVPSVSRPRSGPSALLRSPPRFFLHAAHVGSSGGSGCGGLRRRGRHIPRPAASGRSRSFCRSSSPVQNPAGVSDGFPGRLRRQAPAP